MPFLVGEGGQLAHESLRLAEGRYPRPEVRYRATGTRGARKGATGVCKLGGGRGARVLRLGRPRSQGLKDSDSGSSASGEGDGDGEGVGVGVGVGEEASSRTLGPEPGEYDEDDEGDEPLGQVGTEGASSGAARGDDASGHRPRQGWRRPMGGKILA
jgi:hypothetical protein